MSRIDRYIYLQLLGVFGFFALILVSVYWINRAVGLLDALVGDGQSVGVFIQMSLLTVPSVIELIAPMAAFGAAVFVANKLSQDSEMVVLQATGFSYFRLARAAGFFGLTVALLTGIVTNFLIPAAAAQLRELNSEISRNTTAKYLKEGQFLSPDPAIVLYIREISQNGEMLDMFISDTHDPLVQHVYTSQRAFLVNDGDEPKLLMVDGVLQRKTAAQEIVSISRFADLTYSLKSLIKDDAGGARGIQELSTLELMRGQVPANSAQPWPQALLQYSGHVRVSWPLSSALTAMIGFCALLLGKFSRTGLWPQILAATVLLILMYMVHIVTLSRGPSFTGGWILAYATPLVGGVLTFAVLHYSGRLRPIPPRAPRSVATL